MGNKGLTTYFQFSNGKLEWDGIGTHIEFQQFGLQIFLNDAEDRFSQIAKRNLEDLIDREGYEVMLNNKEFWEPSLCGQPILGYDIVNELSTMSNVLRQFGSAIDSRTNEPIHIPMEEIMVNVAHNIEDDNLRGEQSDWSHNQIFHEKISMANQNAT